MKAVRVALMKGFQTKGYGPFGCLEPPVRRRVLSLYSFFFCISPGDPIFYSTCLVYDVKTEWLPIAESRESLAAEGSVGRQWNFSGYCLDCDSYYQARIKK